MHVTDKYTINIALKAASMIYMQLISFAVSIDKFNPKQQNQNKHIQTKGGGAATHVRKVVTDSNIQTKVSDSNQGHWFKPRSPIQTFKPRSLIQTFKPRSPIQTVKPVSPRTQTNHNTSRQ